MNTARDHRHGSPTRTRTASTASRASSTPTPTRARWSPTPTWCCPTRPISSASTRSRCSTGRSPMPMAPTDAIRHPVLDPAAARDEAATCAASSACCSTSARAWACRACQRGRLAASTATTPTTSSRHERAPGVGLLAGWRGEDGDARSQGRAQSRAAAALHRQRRLLAQRDPRRRALLQDGQPRLPGLGAAHGLPRQHRRRSCCSCIRRRCRSSASRRRATARCSRRRTSRARRDATSIRCRSGTSRSKATQIHDRRTRSSRSARSPSGRCSCTTPGVRRTPGCGRSPRATTSTCIRTPARNTASRDEDWITVESHHGTHHRAGEVRRQRAARHGVDLERDRQAHGRLAAGARTRRKATRASCSIT